MTFSANAVVTLTTDFGTADGYVGAMKGVLHSRFAGARVVDLTHEVPAHDVVSGAFALATAAPFFPDGTVHVAVVDPGVGGTRRAVVATTPNFHFVGPDNGILSLAAPVAVVRLLQNVPGVPRAVSPTFHGRDLFAPAAAYLASGGDPTTVGPETQGLLPLSLPAADRGEGFARGTIVHVDRFGNLVTSIRRADVPADPDLQVLVGGVALPTIRRLVQYYAEAEPDAACALIGSTGFLEIAVREGSAHGRLGMGRGAEVVVRRRSR